MAATRQQKKRWVPVLGDGTIDERFERDMAKARRRSRLTVIAKREEPILRAKGSQQPKPTKSVKAGPNRLEINKRIARVESTLAEVAADLGVDLNRRERVLRGRDLSASGGVIEIERADGRRETIDLGPDKAGDQAVRRLEIPKERREHVARF